MNLPVMFDLTDQVAIVTGGATHLGKAMATGLAELGATTVIASRRRQLCEDVAAEMRSKGLNCTGLQCDATSEGEVRTLINDVVSQFGQLNVMVCNAGGVAVPATYIPNGDVEEFTATLDINVRGTYLCANEAAKVMVPQASGAIITIGSIHGSLTNDKRFYEGLSFNRGGSAYQTAKAGIINFTRYLAMELGEHGITANCISPGQIPKPGTEPIFLERASKLNALSRNGVADDLKGAVALLASPAGSWITGQNVIVDGGWSTW